MSTPKKSKNEQLMEQLLTELQSVRAELAEVKAKQAAGSKTSGKDRPRPGVWYEIKGFPSEKHPPQCIRVMRCLYTTAPEGPKKMSEMDVFNALMGPDTNLGAWNYRQTPFHIFKYYHVPMISGEYLTGPHNY